MVLTVYGAARTQYYNATIAFIADFEALLGSHAAVAALRAHPTYVEFLQRWHQRQLPVYYQIRFREIAGSVEDAVAKLDVSKRAPAGTSDFVLAGSAAVAQRPDNTTYTAAQKIPPNSSASPVNEDPSPVNAR